jgi:2-acylglycerol O-acyltransferase 2
MLIYMITCITLDSSPHFPPPLGSVRKPSNVIERFSLNFWSTHFKYFPITVHNHTTLTPSTQYVFGVHPHGIHCWVLNLFSIQGGPLDSVVGLTSEGTLSGLAASVIFLVPVVRELFIQMGYIDASRSVAERAMKEGRSLFICTGGEEESMLSEVGVDKVVLMKRKGFVRLAYHGPL